MSVIARPTTPRRLARLRGDRAAADRAVTERRGPATAGDTASTAGGVMGTRRLDPPQDRALYSCACGFVFDASVSTSVACPHCGGAQAW